MLAEYRESPWYVALVPDQNGVVKSFCSTVLQQYEAEPQELPGWCIDRIGFLSWPDIHAECKKEDWKGKLEADPQGV